MINIPENRILVDGDVKRKVLLRPIELDDFTEIIDTRATKILHFFYIKQSLGKYTLRTQNSVTNCNNYHIILRSSYISWKDVQ